ncbi:hypothetical protein DENSPDRAFT_365834 [Dentipellis sp. KUC8613]|nr:hypothetical protein DENSPDRAFT_365834 [Dentipellis sp. KUC8613]
MQYKFHFWLTFVCQRYGSKKSLDCVQLAVVALTHTVLSQPRCANNGLLSALGSARTVTRSLCIRLPLPRVASRHLCSHARPKFFPTPFRPSAFDSYN